MSISNDQLQLIERRLNLPGVRVLGVARRSQTLCRELSRRLERQCASGYQRGEE
jgi:hypothetical protein